MKTTALLIALLPASLLLAQPPGGPRPSMMRFNPMLAALDADHDGTISAAELAAAPAVLKGLDKNGDGVLTREEMMPPRGPEGRGPGGVGGPDVVATLLQFDKNGDGKLTKDELPERMQGMVDRGDTNRDGFLSKEEITAMARAQGGAQGRGEEREGGRRPEGRGPGGGPGRGMDPVMVALDTDKDGTISASELANAAVALKVLDKNGDGKITEDELRPAGGPRSGMGGFGGDPAQMVDRLMEQFDKNGDGKLSKEELPAQLHGGMDANDEDKDGLLSKTELRKLLERLRRPE